MEMSCFSGVLLFNQDEHFLYKAGMSCEIFHSVENLVFHENSLDIIFFFTCSSHKFPIYP